jgi:hypothetical protein
MDDYRLSLRVVGITLIVVGVLDIGWMIWCIAHGQDYSSSFNIFAVIAGILLVRGGLRTANVVAFFSAFLLSASIGALLVLPFLMPFDLVLAYLRVYPVTLSVSLLVAVFIIVFLGWIYRRLTAPPILEAIAQRHPRCTKFWRRPRTGFLAGILLVVIIGVTVSFMMPGATAKRAITEAKQKVGEGYKFHVSSWSMQSSGGRSHYAAVVTAYSQKEIKEIPIEWDE